MYEVLQLWKEIVERLGAKDVNAVGISEGQHSTDAAVRKRKYVEPRNKEKKYMYYIYTIAMVMFTV